MDEKKQAIRPRRARNGAYIVIIGVSMVLIYFLVWRDMRFFLVPSRSMTPTLVPPEYLLTLSAPTYKRGDIVVLRDPEDPAGYLVKRIVGIAGDRLQVQGGVLLLNSSYVSEPYCPEPIEYEMDLFTVEENEVFVLGDNRNWSVDSHNWNHGTRTDPRPASVPAASIVGKVRYVYLPVKRMRKVFSYPLTNVAGD